MAVVVEAEEADTEAVARAAEEPAAVVARAATAAHRPAAAVDAEWAARPETSTT